MGFRNGLPQHIEQHDIRLTASSKFLVLDVPCHQELAEADHILNVIKNCCWKEVGPLKTDDVVLRLSALFQELHGDIVARGLYKAQHPGNIVNL